MLPNFKYWEVVRDGECLCEVGVKVGDVLLGVEKLVALGYSLKYIGVM
jgi:hypothetical protein